MFIAGLAKPTTKARGSIIASLDLGSSKIACIIARVEDDDRLQILGYGLQASRGIRAGVIIDSDAAAQAVGQAVHSAEQLARETITHVVVNVAGQHLFSLHTQNHLPLNGHEVTTALIERLIQASKQQQALNEQQRLVHGIPLGFTVDQQAAVSDPRGLHGEQLGINMHNIIGHTHTLRNILVCLERKHLTPEGIVANPFAAGLSALVEDERELGATLIDLGGGTTSIGVFQNHQLIYADCIPLGGQHITMDIARGLNTPIQHAERIKTLYGSVMATSADERELISVPLVGEEDMSSLNQIPRSFLINVIQPRLEEIFELVRERLEVSGYYKNTGRRVVLTGGGSMLSGVRDLAQAILDKQVRNGRPMNIPGLPEELQGPGCATTIGLLLYPFQHFAQRDVHLSEMGNKKGMLGRLQAWLRDNV